MFVVVVVVFGVMVIAHRVPLFPSTPDTACPFVKVIFHPIFSPLQTLQAPVP